MAQGRKSLGSIGGEWQVGPASTRTLNPEFRWHLVDPGAVPFFVKETVMRSLVSLFLLLGGAAGAAAQWSQVFIPLEDKSELPRLNAVLGGLDPCGTLITGAGVELPVDGDQLFALQGAGFNPRVLVANLEEHYAQRLGADRNYGAYHTYSEGMAEINALHAAFPAIVGAPFSIGTTVQGNTIWAFKVSDNPAVDEDEPEVLFGAYIHAREAITIEVLLHFLHHLTDNYGTDQRVTDIVDGRELWFVPFINPDGVLYNEQTNPGGGGMWRKNRRNNGSSFGVDLNRNFGYQWGYDNIGSSGSPSSDTYRGPSANSEPETQALRSFINSRSIAAMQSYHSYSNLIIYPYGYADIQCEEPWHTGYVGMTALLSQDNGYSCGTAWELLYNTNGDAVDWGHGAISEHARIVSITTEVGSGSDGFWPAESRIPALVAENLEPNLLFAELAGNLWAPLPPAAPTLEEPGEVGGDYTLVWSTPVPDANNPAVSYEVQQLSGLASGTDTFGDASNWLAGATSFALSGSRSYSPPTSYYGGTGHNRNAISTLASSVEVQAGLQISLRAWYNIESDWDYAYVEVSPNGVSWSSLAGSITTATNPNGTNEGNGITGASSGFVAATFPLTAWVGQTVQVRLRYRTDGAVLGEGIYIDDFSPVQGYATELTLASGVTQESWAVSNQAAGTWYHRVRAMDAQGHLSGWSNRVTAISSGVVDLEAPLIDHTPLADTPDPAGPWAVAATVEDPSGVALVVLNWRVDGGSWQSVPLAPAGGSLYTGAIPGPLAAGALVEYYLSAVDASAQSNTGSSPQVAFTVMLAPAPTQVSVIAQGPDIQLEWAAVAGALQYHVYRSTAVEGPYLRVASLAGITWIDGGAALLPQRFYRVATDNAPLPVRERVDRPADLH
jgi:hypothetical protein